MDSKKLKLYRLMVYLKRGEVELVNRIWAVDPDKAVEGVMRDIVPARAGDTWSGRIEEANGEEWAIIGVTWSAKSFHVKGRYIWSVSVMHNYTIAPDGQRQVWWIGNQ